jgi:hypothetical protein
MKSTFLSRLQGNARYAVIGALVLIIGVPLYQFLILAPSGYGNALTTVAQSLNWIHTHAPLFLGYRALLIIGFTLMLGLPFTLFRIIIAQEILGRDEEVDEIAGEDDITEREEAGQAPDDQQAQHDAGDATDNDDASAVEDAGIARDANGAAETPDGMPEFAWRGRGFAVLAAWMGMGGLVLFSLATLASSLYLLISASSSSPAAPLTGLFAILTFTAGGGLLALSCLFFGAVITRSGRHLWPDSWLALGYTALAIALLLSGSAVEVALAPNAGQAVLNTPAILLFALWVLWFGVMVVRLKPE